jgi:mRNA interferase MazF
MPPTTSCSFGDILLVPFPFTDASTTKKRPAVVVSSATYNAQRPDLVLMPITSRIRPALGLGEVLVGDWKGAGLLLRSGVRAVFCVFSARSFQI